MRRKFSVASNQHGNQHPSMSQRLMNERGFVRLFFPIVLREGNTTLQENRKDRNICQFHTLNFNLYINNKRSIIEFDFQISIKLSDLHQKSAKNFPSNYTPCTWKFRHIYQTCQRAQNRSTYLFQKTNPTRTTLTILRLDRPRLIPNRAQIAIRDLFVLAPTEKKLNTFHPREMRGRSGTGKKAGYPRGGTRMAKSERGKRTRDCNLINPRLEVAQPVDRKRSRSPRNLDRPTRSLWKKGDRSPFIDLPRRSMRPYSPSVRLG